VSPQLAEAMRTIEYSQTYLTAFASKSIAMRQLPFARVAEQRSAGHATTVGTR